MKKNPVLMVSRQLNQFANDHGNTSRSKGRQRSVAMLAIVFILTFVASAIGAGRTLTVMAQSGAGGLTSVDLNVAINQGNTIAFTAVDSTGSSVFVVSTPGEATRIVDGLSDRSNMGVGITSGTDPIAPIVCWLIAPRIY